MKAWLLVGAIVLSGCASTQPSDDPLLDKMVSYINIAYSCGQVLRVRGDTLELYNFYALSPEPYVYIDRSTVRDVWNHDDHNNCYYNRP